MLYKYKQISEEIWILASDFSKTTAALADKWKTASGEVCTDRLKKIYAELAEISEETEKLSEETII